MDSRLVSEMVSEHPWLIPVIDRYGIIERFLSIQERRKYFESLCNCNVTRIDFLPESTLSPYWKPVRSELSITTKDGWSFFGSMNSSYYQFQDDLQYDISYVLVYERVENATTQTLVARFTVDSLGKSYRNRLLGEFRRAMSRGMRVNAVALVRNISIISQGEYIENRFEVFKFSPGFNPFLEGWSLAEGRIRS